MVVLLYIEKLTQAYSNCCSCLLQADVMIPSQAKYGVDAVCVVGCFQLA